MKNNKLPDFSIIIPNYNGAQFLTSCLNSLHQSIQNCSNSKFEVIFVDNNSKDKSVELVKKITKKFPILNIKYLILNSNYGFAGAVNQGINKAKYKYIVLLNNDLTVSPNWFQLISKQIETNRDSQIVTFFGTVLTKDGSKFESQGLEFFYYGKAQNTSNNQPFSKSLLTPCPVKGRVGEGFLVWGSSAALVVYRKEVIKKIGLFDEDFFAYEEDVDLALRLHNLNYKTVYIPQAISYHLGGGTSNNMQNIRSQLSFRNWFFVIIKNYSSKEILNNLPKIVAERLRNFSYFLKETIEIYKIKSLIIFPFDFLKTIIEILIKLPKMLKKRKIIQKLIKYNK